MPVAAHLSAFSVINLAAAHPYDLRPDPGEPSRVLLGVLIRLTGWLL